MSRGIQEGVMLGVKGWALPVTEGVAVGRLGVVDTSEDHWSGPRDYLRHAGGAQVARPRCVPK